MLGKKKCKLLREIRQRIADENDIPFITEECRYRGDCRGTCPKCEAELRDLEQQLEKRRALGKRVTVSALALGMAASVAGCRPQIAGDMEYQPPTTEEHILVGEVAATDTDAEGTETTATDADAYDPAVNISATVYGPPVTEEETEE